MTTSERFHFNCFCIDAAILIGNREPIHSSYVLSRPPGFSKSCGSEKRFYEETNKRSLDNNTFYLEEDARHKFDFNGGTLTFTWLLITFLT